jgi:hypothetical protein
MRRDLHVAQDARGNNDLASLGVRQAQLGTAVHGLAHDFGDLVCRLVRLQHNFTGDVLDADFDLHS